MAVLLSFLHQLLGADTSDKQFHDDIGSRLGDQRMDISKQIPDADFWNIFRKRVRALDKTQGNSSTRRQICIVLDGLDECNWESIKFLINGFEDLCRTSPDEGEQTLRAVVFRRPKLPRKLQTDRQIDLHDESSVYHTNTLNDIKQFIRNELSVTRKLQVDELESLTEILFRRANGTFLWVSLAMKKLETDEDLVEKIMRTKDLDFLDHLLPEGLYPMFDRMLLDALSGKHTGGGFKPEDAASIVRCVSMAFRPLQKGRITRLDWTSNFRVRGSHQELQAYAL